MKTFLMLLIIAALVTFSNCATIIGGSKYYAHVEVQDHPSAKISYDGNVIGTGDATVKIKRRKANKVQFVIKEADCESQTESYYERSVRWWAVAGTVVGWTGVSAPFIPWGVIVDGITGAWYKPDIKEEGIDQIDYNNFKYFIDYEGCDNKISSIK